MPIQQYGGFGGGLGGSGIGSSSTGFYNTDASDQANQAAAALKQEQFRQAQENARSLQNMQGGIAKEQIAANASMYPAQLKQQRFQTVFPWLQGQFGNLLGNLNGLRPGGASAFGGPALNAGPVWNQQQVQQQVNSMRGQNDAATQAQLQSSQNSLAGRGMSGNSPLMAALGRQYAGQNLLANTQGEQGIRWGAAQGNAQQQLQGQQAREAQFASRQQEDIERRKPYLQTQNALIGALAGLV